MAVHHAVGISRQRNGGYRPSRVNIMAQGLSTPTTTTHYTHHKVNLMVSRNTTLVPSLGLHIGPACEAGLSAGMRKERVPPQRRKRKKRKSNNSTVCTKLKRLYCKFAYWLTGGIGLQGWTSHAPQWKWKPKSYICSCYAHDVIVWIIVADQVW